MDDFDLIPFLQKRRIVSLSGDDIAVELHDHPAGADPQLLQQLFHAEIRRNFSLFSVDVDYHLIKKTVSGMTT